MKKRISIFVLFTIIFSVLVCGAAASSAAEQIIWGDADGDGDVSIVDATCIQRVLVEIPVPSFNMKAAIVSGEDELSIIDATLIQRKLVNLIDRFPAEDQIQPIENQTELKMFINNAPVTVEWEDNESVAALKEAVIEEPLTINLSMYGGFEQVGSLGMTLPRNDTRITTEPGDIVLYSGSNVVLFYGSNTWAYTKLGHISDKTQAELSDLLSNGDVNITIAIDERS